MQSYYQAERTTPPVDKNVATPVQAMMMMTSPIVTRRISAAGTTRVGNLLKSGETDDQIIEELFLATLEKPAAERAAHLDAACAGDPAVRQRIDAMLQDHENSGELLTASPSEMLAVSQATEADGTAAFAPQPNGSTTHQEQAQAAADDLAVGLTASRRNGKAQLSRRWSTNATLDALAKRITN